MALTWHGSDAYRLNCPFTFTVAAARLLLDRESDLRSLVENKVVFYGAGLVGTADTVQPPAHLPLAGVYGHAMALDNLLTFGKNYKREAIPVLLGWPILACPRVLVASGLLVTVLAVRGRFPGRWSRLLAWALTGVLIGLLLTVRLDWPDRLPAAGPGAGGHSAPAPLPGRVPRLP